jgi:hypothetical protein
MDDQLKVKTESIEAKLSFFDGHWEEVIIFLPEQDKHRSSLAKRLLAFFNTEQGAFLAVRRQRGGENILIIRKSRIRWVELEGTDWLVDEDRVGKPCEVGITFPSGDKLRGILYNDLPSGKQRVLDYMNQHELCFLLESRGKVYLVSRQAASRVDDPPLR